MIDDALRVRTDQFALDVIGFCLRLELDPIGRLAQPPLLRAATRLGSQTRAASRARTSKELAAQVSLVNQRLDDAEFWLEALLRLKYGPGTAAHQLQSEAAELQTLFSAVQQVPRKAPAIRADKHYAA